MTFFCIFYICVRLTCSYIVLLFFFFCLNFLVDYLNFSVPESRFDMFLSAYHIFNNIVCVISIIFFPLQEPSSYRTPSCCLSREFRCFSLSCLLDSLPHKDPLRYGLPIRCLWVRHLNL